MPKDDADIIAEVEHAQKCPSCLSTKVRKVTGPLPADEHMGCDSCGHEWLGRDFNFEDAEQSSIPETDPK